MIVITGHNMLDFDALACMVAAKKIYSDAILAFSGIVSQSAREYYSINKDILKIQDIRNYDPSRITQLMIVDTANAERLPGFEEVLKNPKLAIHIIDHHPPMPDDLQGDVKIYEKTGAAATILVELLRIQAQENDDWEKLTEFEATTIAMGIYADTGNLLYDSTTVRDVAAVQWLLEQGANLTVIRDILDNRLSDAQMDVFHQCLSEMRQISVHGVDILLCHAKVKERVNGLAVVTTHLFSVEGAEAIFIMVEDKKDLEIVGRSSSRYVNIAKIVEAFGGRGHIKAASAKVKKGKLDDVEAKLLESIYKNVSPYKTAAEIMTSPVKTLSQEISLEEADKIMLRCGHGGMPIMEKGKLIGMISRRDADKARLHHLEHAPIKGFMSSNVITASPDMPIDHVQSLMVSHDIGRIPIVENGELVGIISRSDIIREMFPASESKELYNESIATEKIELRNYHKWNYEKKMQQDLPDHIEVLLRMIGNIAENHKQKIYVVGGFVRDLIMDLPNNDIDVVCEGDCYNIAQDLSERLKASMVYHERFHTSTVTLPDGLSIDIVTARTEYYDYPAALPQVERSCIQEDMNRRDFTINAMAISLNPGTYGDLIDFFGGREDIKNKKIRVLYHFSFIEDPTRIIRAVRFASRYNFEIEYDTMNFAMEALKRGMVSRLSQERCWHEIHLILNEENPVPALQKLHDLGVLTDAMPQLDNFSHVRPELFYSIRHLTKWWTDKIGKEYSRYILHTMIILMPLPREWQEHCQKKVGIKASVIQTMGKISDLMPWLNSTDWKKTPLSVIEKKIGDLNNEGLLYAMANCSNIGQQRFKEYLLKRRSIQMMTDGAKLKKMGLRPGPHYAEILAYLRGLYLDNRINTPEEEMTALESYMIENLTGDDYRK